MNEFAVRWISEEPASEEERPVEKHEALFPPWFAVPFIIMFGFFALAVILTIATTPDVENPTLRAMREDLIWPGNRDVCPAFEADPEPYVDRMLENMRVYGDRSPRDTSEYDRDLMIERTLEWCAGGPAPGEVR